MVTIDKINKTFKSELKNIYPEREIQVFVEILLEHYTDLRKIDFVLKPQLELNQTVILKLKQALTKLKNNKPLQYIIGETVFYDLKLKVNPSVLIPRPETEELVHWIIENHKEKPDIRILDIGTGSGCIPIALKKKLHKAQVFALDISEKALETAKENAKINQLDISFFNLDIFDNEKYIGFDSFDIIVSNPPYVRKKEKELMHKNVLENEPHIALFVEDNDALVFYKAIIYFANNHLKTQGSLYFEINEALGAELTTLLKNADYKNIKLRQDINGKNRMLKATKA